MRNAINVSFKHTPVILDLDGYDRIRARSSEKINADIERRAVEEIEKYSSENKAVISQRINELDREWDIDRAVMIVFSLLSPISVTLGVKKDRKWFGLFALQLSFLVLHAARGWCPPTPLLRRMGFRSRFEIDAEKYALKTLRGDFRSMST
jgi:hypothetical protein